MDKYRKYKDSVRGAESGGNDNISNPSPVGGHGRYQFLVSTWTGLGYNKKDIFNPKLQEEAMERYTQNSVNILRKRLGIEPTDVDLYGAHFLGAQGYVKLYKANNDAPISTVMSQKEINANPHVKGKTAGWVKGYLQAALDKKTAQYKKNPGKYKSNPQRVIQETDERIYNDNPIGDYYVDSTVRLNQNSGNYLTAPDDYDITEDPEDVEGNVAKDELKQAQQEKNFVNELFNQQQAQQQGVEQAYNLGGYELYMPELPEFQAQQAPSYFINGGIKIK